MNYVYKFCSSQYLLSIVSMIFQAPLHKAFICCKSRTNVEQRNRTCFFTKTIRQEMSRAYHMIETLHTPKFQPINTIVGLWTCPTCALIAKGLQILHDWNPDWKPKYFMTDKSYVELEVIAETFPKCIR